MSERSLVEVRLVGLPVDIWARASAHSDALQREFDIIRHSLNSNSVPNRLLALIEELRARFGGLGDAAEAELRSAAKSGKTTVDLQYQVPPTVVKAVRDIESLLDEADEFCREHLLTLATPAELLLFRKWYLGEFVRQIDEGLPPRAWEEYKEEAVPTVRVTTVPAGTKSSQVIRVEGDLDLASAGALRERLHESLTDARDGVVVDLSQVSFIDSVGLSLLVSVNQRLSDEGRFLQLIIPPHLESLFEITALNEVMEVRTAQGKSPLSG
jgi:anti-anti-sigma factor